MEASNMRLKAPFGIGQSTAKRNNKILAMKKAGVSRAKLAKKYGISEGTVSQACAKAERLNYYRKEAAALQEEYKNNVLEMPVSGIAWTVRTENCLTNEGIETIGQLIKYKLSRRWQYGALNTQYWGFTGVAAELLRIPNFGKKSLHEVITELKKLGLKLDD
jgi:DNA-directed RNA polymerase alpha subunit